MKPGSLFSDRVFTWSILFTIKPEWSQKYYDEVLQFHSKKPPAFEEKKLRVSQNWLAQLQQFDNFTSMKPSKKRSFNVMARKDPVASRVASQPKEFKASDELK